MSVNGAVKSVDLIGLWTFNMKISSPVTNVLVNVHTEFVLFSYVFLMSCATDGQTYGWSSRRLMRPVCQFVALYTPWRYCRLLPNIDLSVKLAYLQEMSVYANRYGSASVLARNCARHSCSGQNTGPMPGLNIMHLAYVCRPAGRPTAKLGALRYVTVAAGAVVGNY